MQPSPWIEKKLIHIKNEGHVLDLACGRGRHTKLLLSLGYDVTAMDINTDAILDLTSNKSQPTNKKPVDIIAIDLEAKAFDAIPGNYDAIIISNYLHRPLFPMLQKALKPDGIIIYQTFMLGNEQYGKPSNPDYLLKKNELLNFFGKNMLVIDFRQGITHLPHLAVTQSICVQKTA